MGCVLPHELFCICHSALLSLVQSQVNLPQHVTQYNLLGKNRVVPFWRHHLDLNVRLSSQTVFVEFSSIAACMQAFRSLTDGRVLKGQSV